MKKTYALFIFILLLCQIVFAQSDSTLLYSNKNKFYIGVGLGLTYGGLGGKLAHNPSESIGLFLGLGYNFVGLGYNTGLIYYLPTDKLAQGYFSVMYGTNSVIKVEGVPHLDEKYNGPSFGFGVILKSPKNTNTHWDLGVIVPVRSSQFKDDWEGVKNMSGIEVTQDALPILVNIGYNFTIN